MTSNLYTSRFLGLQEQFLVGNREKGSSGSIVTGTKFSRYLR